MKDHLKEVAKEVRLLASVMSDLPVPQQTKVATTQTKLDSRHVLNFLKFYGVRESK